MIMFRNISFSLVLLNMLFVFSVLYAPRYKKRTTVIASTVYLGAVSLLNLAGIMAFGADAMLRLMPVSFTLPTHLFFFFMSKYRDGRFLFTLFLVDVFTLWIICVTSMTRYFGVPFHFLLSFAIRIALLVLMDYYVLFFFRKAFLQAPELVRKGWFHFTLIAVLFCILMLILVLYPLSILDRPLDLPILILILLIVPLVLYALVHMMIRQLQFDIARHNAKLMSIHTKAMEKQLESIQESEQQMRIFRHDIRHYLNQMQALLQDGHFEEAKQLLAQYTNLLENDHVTHYCENSVINAVLNSYLGRAIQQGIPVITNLDIPQKLAIDLLELSGVLANAIENACNACQMLPEGIQKWINITCVSQRQYILEVSNPYAGEITFGADGLPVATQQGHGIGTLSIAAFAKKHGAILDYQVRDGTFRMRIIINKQN